MESGGMKFKWEGSKYKALGIRTTHKKWEVRAQNLERQVTVRFPLIPATKKSPFSPEVQRIEYYQILLISDKGVLSMKSWSNPEVLRTFQLERKDKKEKQLIEDGLKREDQEVFCIVAQIMGKEVLGRVNCLPKHAPIIQLPDEMLEKIFSYLPSKDRLHCRGVCNRFLEILPVTNFLKCRSVQFTGRSILGDVRRICTHKVGWDLDLTDLPQNLIVAALQQTPTVCIKDAKLDPQKCALLGSDKKLNEMVVRVVNRFQNHEDRKKFLDEVVNVVQHNKAQLETIGVYSRYLYQGRSKESCGRNLDLQPLLNGCCNLRRFSVTLYDGVSIKNVDSLPIMIQELNIGRLKVPLLNKEVKWILENLKKLVRVELHVQHFHGTDKANDQMPCTEGEDITGAVISDALQNLTQLKLLRFRLGFLGYGGTWNKKGTLGSHGCCEKVLRMLTAVERKLGKTGWKQSRDVQPILEHDDIDIVLGGEFVQFERISV